MKLLLALLLFSGCSPAGVTSFEVPKIVEGGAFVDFRTQDRDDPWARRWQDGSTNVWVRLQGRCQSMVYPYSESSPPYAATLVYKAKLPPFYLAATDTTYFDLCTFGAEENCSVTSGSGWIVTEGDTLLRGLCIARVNVAPCGSRNDSLWVVMDRADLLVEGTTP